MPIFRLLILLVIFAGAAADADDDLACVTRCGARARDVFAECRARGVALDACLGAATEVSRRCTARCPSTTPPGQRCDLVADDAIRQCMAQIADARACTQHRDDTRDRCARELADSGDVTTVDATLATSPSD